MVASIMCKFPQWSDLEARESDFVPKLLVVLPDVAVVTVLSSE